MVLMGGLWLIVWCRRIPGLPERVVLEPVPALAVGESRNLTCHVLEVAPVRNLTVTLRRGAETLRTASFGAVSGSASVAVTHVLSAGPGDHGQDVTCHAELSLRPHGPLFARAAIPIRLSVFGESWCWCPWTQPGERVGAAQHHHGPVPIPSHPSPHLISVPFRISISLLPSPSQSSSLSYPYPHSCSHASLISISILITSQSYSCPQSPSLCHPNSHPSLHPLPILIPVFFPSPPQSHPSPFPIPSPIPL